MRRARGALLVALLCAACGAHKRPSVPSDKLWADGGQAMQDEAWDLAVQDYKQLLEQYPFDPNAEEAEVKIAEAYFNEGRYPEAIAAFGDFERMHPTSDNLAQIEYRRGMAYLAQHRSADRDQLAIKNALDSFRNSPNATPARRGPPAPTCACASAARSSPSTTPGSRGSTCKRGSLRAAESRLRGLLVDYPETQATAQTLDQFAKVYAARDEPEEANLALATLVRYHGDSQIGQDARTQLKSLDPAEGQDPLPMLVARIDAMRTQADRENPPAPGVGLLRPARDAQRARRTSPRRRWRRWGRCLRSETAVPLPRTDMIETLRVGWLSGGEATRASSRAARRRFRNRVRIDQRFDTPSGSRVAAMRREEEDNPYPEWRRARPSEATATGPRGRGANSDACLGSREQAAEDEDRTLVKARSSPGMGRHHACDT